jgi:uncharacterized ubiquitin-like protein YukD
MSRFAKTRVANACAVDLVEIKDSEMAHVERVDAVHVMVDSLEMELNRRLGPWASVVERRRLLYEDDKLSG